jgi:hypothetical protein
MRTMQTRKPMPTMEPMPSTTAAPGRDRVAALAGLGFAITLFLAVASVDMPKKKTDQQVLDWWSDSGHRAAATVSMYLVLAAGLAFAVFATRLRAHLRRAEGGPTAPAAPTPGTDLVHAAGLVFVALVFVAGALRGVIGAAVDFADEPLPGVDVLRFVPQLSATMLGVFAMAAAGCFIAAASWVIAHTGAFARWVAWLGVVAVVGIVAAGAAFVAAFAIPLVLIWVLAVSIQLWRAGSPEVTTTSRG